MIDIENTLAVLREHELDQWADHLAPILTYQQENPHGDLARWKSALDGLPVIQSGDACRKCSIKLFTGSAAASPNAHIVRPEILLATDSNLSISSSVP